MENFRSQNKLVGTKNSDPIMIFRNANWALKIALKNCILANYHKAVFVAKRHAASRCAVNQTYFVGIFSWYIFTARMAEW